MADWESAPVVNDTPAWQAAPEADSPHAPPEAYVGWDTPNKPPAKEKAAPKDKPTSWDKEHPLIAYTNTFHEPFATAAGLGLIAGSTIRGIAESLGIGFASLWNRMDMAVNHPEIPFQPIHGLTPDEFGAFSTLMTLGAGDLPGSALGRRVDLTPKPDKATKKVAKRVGEDLSAQGVTAQQAADELSAGRALGAPLMLADQGENARGLLGAVSRIPGRSGSFCGSRRR